MRSAPGTCFTIVVARAARGFQFWVDLGQPPIPAQTGRNLGRGFSTSMESSMFDESSEEKPTVPDSVLQNLLLKVSSSC
jgi:hypothetical protein